MYVCNSMMMEMCGCLIVERGPKFNYKRVHSKWVGKINYLTRYIFFSLIQLDINKKLLLIQT